MAAFAYDLKSELPPQIGLVALQSDLRIESDFRRLIPISVDLLVSRVVSAPSVTPETLSEMALHLTRSATLFPQDAHFAAVGYGCTSGTAQIGAARIAELVQNGTQTEAVSEPVSALIAACKHLNVRRLALLSPYIESVSARLRDVLAEHDIDVPVFGSFDEAEESRVARIAPASLQAAALDLGQGADVDALFLSCTNLDTLDVIDPLEQALGLPVLSSNQVLAWHLLKLAGVDVGSERPGRLWD